MTKHYIKGRQVSKGRIRRLLAKFKDAAVVSEYIGNSRDKQVVQLIKDGKTVLRYEVKMQ